MACPEFVTSSTRRGTRTESVAVCRGSFRALLFCDISQKFDLEELRGLSGTTPADRTPGCKLPVPGYVRYERPPVLQVCEPIHLTTGETANASLRYFDYGVISLEIEVPFESDWPELISLSNRWIDAGEVEQRGTKTVRNYLIRLRSTQRKPYAEWLDEAYYVVDLREVRDDTGNFLNSSKLISQFGREISQVIRGETQPLSTGEQTEILASSFSYYPTCWSLAGWRPLCTTPWKGGAPDPVAGVRQHPTSRILAVRRNPKGLLKDAYATLERRKGFFSRWGLARDAEQLNRLRLAGVELTERADNAVKFLSDMFYARIARQPPKSASATIAVWWTKN